MKLGHAGSLTTLASNSSGFVRPLGYDKSKKTAIIRNWSAMITYRAMYKFLDDGVHAEVLDFPGVISCGHNLAEARRLLSSALVDMAETCLHEGATLPSPDPSHSDPDADLEEPIHLLLQAATRVSEVPQDVAG